ARPDRAQAAGPLEAGEERDPQGQLRALEAGLAGDQGRAEDHRPGRGPHRQRRQGAEQREDLPVAGRLGEGVPRQPGREREAALRRRIWADAPDRLERDQGRQVAQPQGRVPDRRFDGAEVRPGVRVGTAQAPDGAVLTWRADGEGSTALVAANGIGVSTFFWRRLAEHFAPERTFVTWDYRGHGRTPVPEHPEELTVA